MRWAELLECGLELMKARPALAGVKYRRTRQVRDVQPNSIGYTVIATPGGDGWQEVVLQLDLWGPSYEAVLGMEKEVRAAFDRGVDFPGPFGFRMSSELGDGRDGDEEPGLSHRIIEEVRLRAARN